MTWVARLLKAWPLKKPGPGEGSGVDDGGNGTGLTDEDVICSCLNVTKATVKRAIEYEGAITIPAITNCTKAGTGGGSRTEGARKLCCQKDLPSLRLHSVRALRHHQSKDADFSERLPCLAALDLRHCSQIRGIGMRALASGSPGLTS